MGSSPSNTLKSYDHFMSAYKHLTNLSHENFGEISIYEHRKKPDLKILEKVFFVNEELAYQKTIKLLELKSNTKFPHYCQILAYCHTSEWGCGGTGFVVKIAVEYFEINLFQLSMMGSQNPNKIATAGISEEQAWIHLECIVELASFFKRYNLSIGEISPENVLLDNRGEVKFMDMNLLTLNTSLFDRLKNRAMLTAYALSPEQLEKLKNSSNHEIDEEKSDIFCIAIFMICSILQEPFKGFYDYTTYELNFEQVFKKIVKLKKAEYTDDFTDLMVEMTKKNPKDRPSIKFLYSQIQVILRNSMKTTIRNH